MKLTEYEKNCLFRGTVLRIKGSYPFTEDKVDFMICEFPTAKPDVLGLALFCVSGYEAGHFEYLFPSEAGVPGTVSVDRDWLIKNWNKKIYLGCDVSDVEIKV